MMYLLQGMESKKRVELLLSLTRIESESVVSAIYDHLVAGHSEKDACLLNDATQSNFNRAMSKLNNVAGIVEQIKEIDLSKSVK
jgi:hypothetical protein